MKNKFNLIIAVNLALLIMCSNAYPCTGITLKSKDGGFVVPARLNGR